MGRPDSEDEMDLQDNFDDVYFFVESDDMETDTETREDFS